MYDVRDFVKLCILIDRNIFLHYSTILNRVCSLIKLINLRYNPTTQILWNYKDKDLKKATKKLRTATLSYLLLAKQTVSQLTVSIIVL